MIDRFYGRLPVFLQEVGITTYGAMWWWRRFGPGFARALRHARERESYDEKQWEAYQVLRLRELLVHAARRVPHYRAAFASSGLAETSLAAFTLEDLRRLPIVDKQDIRPDPKRFVAEGAKGLHPYATSGSTGTPLTVYMSSATQRQWQALYEARCRNWAGVNRHMRRAMIGGRQVVPRADANRPYGRRNWAEGQLYLSAFHVSRKTCAQYVKELAAFQPDYLVGYASAWFFLARFIVEEGLQPPRVKAILTSSEKLEPAMRDILQRAFDAPVFDAYSGVEACCLASECEKHALHVSPDAGIIELLDPQGNPVGPGQQGEIVATGLVNFDQPLIRYRTGDLARWGASNCACGRKMPILESLVGRLEDVVFGPDGRETVRFHGLYLGLPHVTEGQVVQEAPDFVRLRVVVTPEFDERDEATLRRRVLERLGEVTVVVEPVEELERTPAGKVRAVISKVSRDRP